MLTSGQLTPGGPGTLAPGGPTAVHATTLGDLVAGGGATDPALLDRHVLLLVTVGHGGHTVDFVEHPCRPGTLIWARPGQMIRYEDQPGLDAVVVSWPPAPGEDTDPTAHTRWQLTGEDEDAVINEISQLVVDCERHRAGQLPAELLARQLATLVLRISLLPHCEPVGRPGADDTFSRFRREIQRGYAGSRRVEEYAARLDCSVRTLTRACLAATGRSAKQVIDDRVALAAKRMLACTTLSVAEIGQRLGFPEPTNFGRFFLRETGCSPGSFRVELSSTPPASPATTAPPSLDGPPTPAGQLTPLASTVDTSDRPGPAATGSASAGPTVEPANMIQPAPRPANRVPSGAPTATECPAAPMIRGESVLGGGASAADQALAARCPDG